MFYEPLDGWQQVTNKDSINIYKTMKPGKGSVFVRGDAFLKDVTKSVAIKAICNEEFRKAWLFLSCDIFLGIES